MLIDRLDRDYIAEIGSQDGNDDDCHLGEALYCVQILSTQKWARKER